jgi:ATP-dependent RNA helicase DDX21
VHRAGRTGRAGKNGVCVTFYNSRSKYLMSEIEKMAKITFKHIAEPKNIDILRANCREVINKIKSIDEGVADYF